MLSETRMHEATRRYQVQLLEERKLDRRRDYGYSTVRKRVNPSSILSRLAISKLIQIGIRLDFPSKDILSQVPRKLVLVIPRMLPVSYRKDHVQFFKREVLLVSSLSHVNEGKGHTLVSGKRK